MSKKINPLDQINKENPFRTPDGYFENLSTQIMSVLPEKVDAEPKVLTIWDRVKPWAYMAAMFVGIALMVKIFVISTPQSSSFASLDLQSGVEIDEFLTYYEESAIKNIYRESVYYEEADYSYDNNHNIY